MVKEQKISNGQRKWCAVLMLPWHILLVALDSGLRVGRFGVNVVTSKDEFSYDDIDYGIYCMVILFVIFGA